MRRHPDGGGNRPHRVRRWSMAPCECSTSLRCALWPIDAAAGDQDSLLMDDRDAASRGCIRFKLSMIAGTSLPVIMERYTHLIKDDAYNPAKVTFEREGVYTDQTTGK